MPRGANSLPWVFVNVPKINAFWRTFSFESKTLAWTYLPLASKAYEQNLSIFTLNANSESRCNLHAFNIHEDIVQQDFFHPKWRLQTVTRVVLTTPQNRGGDPDNRGGKLIFGLRGPAINFTLTYPADWYDILLSHSWHQDVIVWHFLDTLWHFFMTLWRFIRKPLNKFTHDHMYIAFCILPECLNFSTMIECFFLAFFSFFFLYHFMFFVLIVDWYFISWNTKAFDNYDRLATSDTKVYLPTFNATSNSTQFATCMNIISFLHIKQMKNLQIKH